MFARVPELILGVGGLLFLIASIVVLFSPTERKREQWAIIDSEFVVFSPEREGSMGNEAIIVEV